MSCDRKSSVGVVIPCYNYGKYLEACVKSVLEQNGVDVRILIIDDASPDDSADIAQALSQLDNRIQFRRHAKNMGHIQTYNEGLSTVSEEFTVLLSADDLLTPGCLLRATELMRKYPSVGFVYGHPVSFSGETVPIPRAGKGGQTVWKGADWIALMCQSGSNFIHSPEVVMRTSVQSRIGGYKSELPHSGDMEMWLRAACVSDVGRVSGCDQAFYRVHPKSMQRTTYSTFIIDLQGRRDAFQSALSVQESIPHSTDLLRVADDALALAALKRAYVELTKEEGSEELVRDCKEFARRVRPEIVDERAWRRIEAREKSGPYSKLMIWAWSRWCRAHEILRWRRWRRTGIA